MITATVGRLHERAVFQRRVSVLGEVLGDLAPAGCDILDVGTGDGQIARLIAQRSGAVAVSGLDIMERPCSHVPVTLFDGRRIPCADKSVDVVTFVDVLHHTDDPGILLAEAARVARKAVIVKDHLSETLLDEMTLRAMDWVGNAPHGVVLPYNYGARRDWMGWFAGAGLKVDALSTDVPLYPVPLSLVFGRKLHFAARLIPTA